ASSIEQFRVVTIDGTRVLWAVPWRLQATIPTNREPVSLKAVQQTVRGFRGCSQSLAQLIAQSMALAGSSLGVTNAACPR
ncbi:MAG: hypothetical protein RMH97_05720, partial [Verrucomicrobiales bacterium]|nr:hypothetical protein [Verrucomicrobiales bacterium]